MEVYDSVVEHPDWKKKIKPFLVLEYYGREGRIRIEVLDAISKSDKKFLKSIRTRCARCKARIAPFRERKGGSMFFAASGTLDKHIGCSRSKAASLEYARVADFLTVHY
jgi:hypothetical protein